MPQLLRSRRSYDHWIREIVCETGNPAILHHLRIPRSTTASWLSRGRRSVVSLDWEQEIALVLNENEKLKRRAERQTAIIRLLVVPLKLSGFRLDERRLPDGLQTYNIRECTKPMGDPTGASYHIKLLSVEHVGHDQNTGRGCEPIYRYDFWIENGERSDPG